MLYKAGFVQLCGEEQHKASLTQCTGHDTGAVLKTAVAGKIADLPAGVRVLAPAPVAQATVVTQNQAAAQGVTQIADEAAPLAANVEEDTQKTAEEAPKAEEAVNIADEAVPLADVAVESEQAKMSWWWWLIILILGATGYEMYKKHNEKKLKAQAENAGDIEE